MSVFRCISLRVASVLGCRRTNCMFVDFEIKSYGKHRHYTHRREGQMNTNQSNMEYDLRVMKRNLRVTQRREGKTVTFNFLDGDVAGLMQDAQAIPIPWQFELTPLD